MVRATFRAFCHDSSYKTFFLNAKKVIFAKILVFWGGNRQFSIFLKTNARTCLVTSYYIKKSGSPQNLRHGPIIPYLYLGHQKKVVRNVCIIESSWTTRIKSWFHRRAEKRQYWLFAWIKSIILLLHATKNISEISF